MCNDIKEENDVQSLITINGNIMCNRACIQFAASYLTESEIKGKKVLEVGSLNVNGSVRDLVEGFEPLSYTGVDIENGPGVDQLCDVVDLLSCFGKESFDLVIATEVLEHICNWRDALSNIKNVLKPKGILLITTRSKGFIYHGYPYDFWRYELEDIKTLFSDFSIEVLNKDPLSPGVFVKMRKPSFYTEKNLGRHKLYSIIKLKRCSSIRKHDILFFKMVKKPLCTIITRVIALMISVVKKITANSK